MLEAARSLAPQIRAFADRIEAERELPRELFDTLADAGLFKLGLPRSLEGVEIDLPSMSTCWRSWARPMPAPRGW